MVLLGRRSILHTIQSVVLQHDKEDEEVDILDYVHHHSGGSDLMERNIPECQMGLIVQWIALRSQLVGRFRMQRQRRSL